MVRIERQVEVASYGTQDSYGDRPIFPHLARTISVEVPADADDFMVARALHDLETIADVVRRLSDCCGVPLGAVHNPTCSYAQTTHIADCRELALENGMRP